MTATTIAPAPAPVSGMALAFVGSPQRQESPDDSDWQPPESWFGNIQYLINISIIGALCCLFVFLVVKLRSDHQVPGPASLAAKLLAVWHTTGQQVARLCGANASQYLVVEGYSFLSFLAVSFLALLLLLPLNVYGGTVPLQDQFARSTVIHIAKGSSLLWGHYFFMVAVVGIMHVCIQTVDKRLTSTRFHGEVSADSIAAFTLMIHGIPRTLAVNKRPLQEYFEHRYPGKLYRVIVPPDLSTFCYLEKNLVWKRKQLLCLQAQSRSSFLTSSETDFYREDGNELVDFAGAGRSRFVVFREAWYLCKSIVKQVWLRFLACGGCTEEDAITKVQLKCADLESKLLPYREGRAPGAGIAFVIFKDLRTASRALQDIKSQARRGIPSISEIELAQSRWKAERAPPARDIYWHHLGSSTLSRVIRRIAVNVFLLLLLFFFSSPLAALTALHNVGRLINPEAMDHVQAWLAWVQSSSWAGAVVLQFLPNVLIFLSMYLVIPTALSSLSSFESHLTLSGEQRAALVKTVLFFLVNLIFLRGLLETSLEAALLHVGRCYAEGAECKDIEQYMSSSFLANSCLSVTAFLITSTFLGISYDLLSPIPWIKRKIQQFKRQHLLDYGAGSPPLDYSIIAEESLQEELLVDGSFNFSGVEPGARQVASVVGIVENGEDLSVYPLARDVTWRTQAFDYAQYYAFNLTIFAMALIYSSFVPAIVPIAALYFGYRYAVDKYNFLFMYRVRGFPAVNDGKLLGTVLRVMRICIVLYLFAMLHFFYIRGDREKLQFLCTLAVVVLVCMKYGYEKLISPPKNGFDVSVAENLGSVENFVNGSLDYEVLAQPNFDWDIPAA